MVTNFGQQVVHGRVRKLDEDAPVLAQAFTTGVDRGSFEATRIGFKVAKVNEVDGFDVTVSLYEARGTGRPRTKIADLVRSNSITEFRRNYWEVPDGIILEPDTSYVVVVRCDLGATAAEMCNGDEYIRFRAVEDNDEDDVDHGVDEGLFDGWSIANNGFGGVWGGLSGDNASHAMAVKGYSARIPYILDNGVTVTSTPGDGGDTYSYGETIEITVRLSRAILVDFDPIVIENDFGIEITHDSPLYPDIAPSLRFSLGDPGAAQDRYAHYASGNYTNTLKFHYIVTSGDMDTDGIEIPAGDDAFGHNLPRAFQGDTTRVIANLEFPALGIQTDHKVDSTPKIDTVNLSEPIRITSVPAIGTTYRNREVVEVTVTFDQPVLVTPPVKARIGIDGGSGGKWRGAAYSHGSGTESVAFRYVVTEEDIDTDGIEILPNVLAQGGDPHHVDGVQGAGDITSIRGSLAIDLASAGVPDDSNHKVDGSMTNPHVEVSPVQLVVDEGDSAGASYMVWLTEEPSGSVTVTVDGLSGTDVSVDSASLTFTTADWSTRQTVTVTADQDDDAEDDEVTLTHTVAGGGYGSATATDVTVTVRDNDTQGVTTSMMALTVPEGGTATYTVVLNAEPASDVTVIVTGGSGDVSIDGAIAGDRVLTFTSVNWNVPQTVTVRAAEDGDAVADDPVTLINALAGGGSVAVTVMVTENDTTSVSVAPTDLRVNEGTSDTYTVVLTALPTGNVTVTVSGASGDVMVDRTSLTFTPVTWQTAQTVTVTAAQDADEVNDTVTLTHAVAGGGYDGVVVSDVEVTVEDDERGVTVSETALTVAEGDAAGSSYTVVLATQPTGDVTVTVGGHSGTHVSVSSAILTFTPAMWQTAQTVTVTAGQDPDGLNDTVTLTHSVSGGGYDGADVASVEVTVEDDDRGVVVSETELTVTEGDATGSSYTVVLAAQPTGDVTVTVGGHSGTDVSVSSVSLTFSTTTWETTQTVTVTAAQDADGVNDSVTLTHAVAGGGYDGVVVASVEVTVEDDERGVVVSETELTVTEGDATGSSYTLVLSAQPTGDVTVTVDGHSGTHVSVSSAILTFTPAMWQTAQTVTVTAGQDPDGLNDTVTLTHSVSGGGYDGVDVASVEVTVEDDDRGVVVSETELTVTEGDATGSSYTVVLAAQPTGDVTVTVGGHSGTDVSVSSVSLTFSTTTWETAQTVTVTAAQDADGVNDSVTLTHAVAGGGYDGVVVASVEVTVEDDERGVVVSETELTVTEGDATGSSYTVVLSAQPTGDVTVTVDGHSGTHVSVSSAILTFTPAMWQTAQTVTVTAGQDPDGLNDTVTLTHSVSGGGYDGVDVASVEVTVADDDRGVVVSETELTVTEGDATGSSYTVVLAAQPTGDVTVTVGGHSGTDVSVSSVSLTFSTTTWETAQTVTVTAAQDADGVNDSVTLTHAVAGGGYDGVVVASVEVTVEDDERGVVVSETGLTVTEGDATGSSYTVVLSAQPTGDVTVTVDGHSGTHVSVSSAILTFTPAMWQTAQTVTVTAGQDPDGLNDTVTLTHSVSGGGYDGVDVASVEVTVEDDDRGVVVSETELTVTEGDATGSSYTVVLAAQPTGDVTVTVGGHSGTHVSVSSAILTFTPAMWQTAQTVTVTAGQDPDGLNDTVTLTHSVSGGGYDGVDVASVEVTVEDDDRGVVVSETELTVTEGDATGSSYTLVLSAQPTGDVTVTVGGHSGTDVLVSSVSLTFSTTTWQTEQTVTVTAEQDLDALSDTVTLTHAIAGGGYDGVDVASVEVTVADDERGVVVSGTVLTGLTVTEGDATGSSYTLVLSAQPTGDVTVTVGGYSGTDVSVSSASLTFSTASWPTQQTVTVTAGQDLDAWNDTVTLTHAVSGGGYDDVVAASVEVTVEDDDRGVVVSETELTVTEGDAAGSSYTVVLSAEPTGDVTVTVGGHSGTDVLVSSASLTFAAVTWNTAQTVTVTAGHDADASNDTVTLTHAVTGGGYDGVVVSNVDVTVEDDDSQGVIVAPTTLEVREGGTGTYTVVLAAEPAGDVAVTVGGYSGTEVSVSRDILTFTPATWYTEQTVTVTAGQDADALNDAVMLSHSISLVRGFGGVVASVEVTVKDDDAARVTVAPTTLVVREGSTGRYTVVLTAEPTGDVTVTVGGYSGTDVTVDNTSLTFSTITWETEQTVTVTAGQDAGEVNDTVALTHSVSGGGYDGVDVASVVVKVADDEKVTGDVEPSGSIRLCGARLDPRPDGLSESEIDICWDVESAIPGDVVIEMRSRNHWDAPYEPNEQFTKWQRVERGNSFTPCDVAAETCVKATQGFLYRGEPRTYELRIRRGTTLLAKSPRLKAQAPNRSTNVFEPRLARDSDTGSDGAVGQPSGPYNLKLAFSEEYPEDYFLNIWRTETVPCLGSEAQCLEPQDFDVTNATLTIKAWREGLYRIEVTPTTLGRPVSVSLPANKVKGVGEGVEADGTNQYTRYNVASNEVVTPTSTPRIRTASGSSLTAQFDAKPASHDGMTPFTVRIAFSEAVSTTAAALRDHVVEVTGGTVTAADRVDGRSDLWEFTIEPASSADVTVVVPAGRDCAGSGAVCTPDGRPLLNGLAAVIAGPGAGTRAVPLTAQFDSMPVEHDGAAAFTFELRFSEAISTPKKALRDHAITVSGARVEKAKRVDGRSDRWRITVAPDSHADVTVILAAGRPCTETGAVCTAAGEPLSNALAAVVRGPTALSVADARAREGVDAAIVFDVTLDRAAFAPVTVGYATGDGSARAGEDFTETSGTLTFAVGETVESVVVPLLDDAKDEGEETFTLTLANVSGARIADSQAVGTIVNDDPLQTQWIAHFGRTVASQAVEAIEERLDGRGDTHVTVGGIRLTGRKPTADDAQTRVDPWPDELEPVWETRTMTGRELLLGSAFLLRTGGEDGVPRWTAWGRFARDGFRANVDGVRLSGAVTTGLLGADVSREGWLAGVALGVSEGAGPFSLTSRMASGCSSGTVESDLTSVFPYARLRLTERLDVWGMAGLGDGEMTIDEPGCGAIATGIGMKMGAAGARGTLLEAGIGGSPLDLGSRADVLLVQMKSRAVDRDAGPLESANARVSRVRLLLEGGRSLAIGANGSLEPTFEAGVRHDGGDAETGTGLEVGAGLRYARPRVTIQGSVRKMLAHEASGYEEWGVSGSVRIHPEASDRGLSFNLTPAWGADSSGVERLWSLPDATGLAGGEDFDATRRLDAEVGYGVGLRGGLGVVTPYTGIRLGDEGARTWRIGARWELAPEVHLGLDATRYARDEHAPNDAVRLALRMRW